MNDAPKRDKWLEWYIRKTKGGKKSLAEVKMAALLLKGADPITK